MINRWSGLGFVFIVAIWPSLATLTQLKFDVMIYDFGNLLGWVMGLIEIFNIMLKLDDPIFLFLSNIFLVPQPRVLGPIRVFVLGDETRSCSRISVP